jgi:hypothetical protein
MKVSNVSTRTPAELPPGVRPLFGDDDDGPTAPPVAPVPARPQVAALPRGVELITDDDGRKLQLRELTLLEESDVIIASGAHGENQRTLNRALLCARVAAITDQDGDPVGIPVPKTPEHYKRMMTLVGRAGINAVVAHLMPDDDEAASSEIDNAKN